jgi:hypothetical protein
MCCSRPPDVRAQTPFVRQTIDIHEGDKIDEEAFTALIRSAVELNTA